MQHTAGCTASFERRKQAAPPDDAFIPSDAYDFDDARDLLEDLPNELPRRVGADALAALEAGAARLGADVPTVASTLAATLPQLISCELDPAGTDNQVNAALRDIADRLRRQLRRNKRYQGLGGPSPGFRTERRHRPHRRFEVGGGPQRGPPALLRGPVSALPRPRGPCSDNVPTLDSPEKSACSHHFWRATADLRTPNSA